MENFLTLEELEVLFRPLSSSERTKADALIPVVQASLQMEADKVGQNLEEMVQKKPFLCDVLKSVMADVIGRTLMTSTDQEPVSQFSQSALGYSVSGTYLVPGGGLFIKKSELARLGLRKPRIRMVEIYGNGH